MRRGGKDMGHREEEHWQAKRCPDPKAPRHIMKSGIFFAGARHRYLRLKRHPADGAVTRLVLLDLGMHGAGISRSFPESRIDFQRHPALRTIARSVALDAFAHWAEVSLCNLGGRSRLAVIMRAARMCFVRLFRLHQLLLTVNVSGFILAPVP